jgi:FkbH-like protein
MEAFSNGAIEYILQRAAPDRLLDEALALIQFLPCECAAESGETIANCLAARLCDRSETSAAIASLEREQNAVSRFVRARLHSHAGDLESTLDGYSSALQSLSSPEPWILLQRARLLGRQGRHADAIADARSALRQFPPYSFFVKSEKLLAKLSASDAWQPARKVKAAILGSSTTALLAPVLRAAAFREGVQLDIYEGVYGNLQQEILDPDSGLYRFKPDLVLLMPNRIDLALPPVGGLQRAIEYCGRLRELWGVLQGRNPCHIVQVGLETPHSGTWGNMEYTLPEGRRRAIAEANLALSSRMPAGVSFLDINAAAAQFGRRFFSQSEWHSARQYPSSAALPLVADHLYAHCAAALGLGKKVLVLDLDNTLWGGVIGEDLLGGIRIGPPTALGEGCLELQKYAKDLQRRGVLLAVCSKNNRADAELPFLKHDAMHLKLDDFAAFAANWNDKATNLRAIAEDLSLGLDSFVFLDDNPAERALVRRELPQVAVPECGQNPWDMMGALERGMYFEGISLTEEDARRHESYRGIAARKALESAAPSLDDFLRDLQMTVEHGPVDDATLKRVAQLINKTNQFNLTARRYTEEQVKAMAESPSWWCRWFRLADRFGDHGLIGVVLAEKGRSAWRIDTWLMSCRVLGRKVEEFMCRSLLSDALADGVSKVVGQYVPSAKNALVKDLYAQLGFVSSSDMPDEYVFALGRQRIPTCGYFTETLRESDSRRPGLPAAA